MIPTVRRIAIAAAAELAAAGVPDEQLADLVPARRIGPILRRARFVPTGRAWRLGAVLVDAAGSVWTTGSVTRAVVPRQFAANKSPAEEQRRDLQRTAAKAFPVGETVDFGHEPVGDGADAAIVERGGILWLRLADQDVAFEPYLADRVRLAVQTHRTRSGL